MNIFCKYILIFTVFLAPAALLSQGIDQQLERARGYHNSYDFDKALGIYESVLKSVTDSLKKNEVIEQMVLSQNGKNMLQFATIPTVVSKKCVPANDFYLYYSHLQDKSWIPLPNEFVKESGHPFYTAAYFLKESGHFYFSTKDNSGVWNIYHTESQGDTLWRTPELINENLTSSEDDVFPLLSPSGKELYFSSKGLFGMGGYDIFVSRWNEETRDWDIPQNLGFPFSSPYDDFLFSDTQDGNFTIFASNRDCHRDSINIYVLAFENTPIKQEVESLEQARELARLDPVKSVETSDFKENLSNLEGEKQSQDFHSDSLFTQYTFNLAALRSKQDSIWTIRTELEENRDLYAATTNENDLKTLERIILSTEQRAITLQMEADVIARKVQELEMDFLLKGIILPTEAIENIEEETKEVGELLEYNFTKHSLGVLGDISIEAPVESFDYSFKVLDTAVFAESNDLPEGIVYQIQLFVTSSKVTLKQLKGLSPVFERKLPSGKYHYAVGLFRSYKEVLSNLNTVKRAGFPSAFVVAYNSGKSLSVNKARNIEKQVADSAKYRVILGQFSDGIPDAVLTLIRKTCSKDIVKSFIDGEALYVIAPFDSRKEADDLAAILIGEGVQGVIVEEIK